MSQFAGNHDIGPKIYEWDMNDDESIGLVLMDLVGPSMWNYVWTIRALRFLKPLEFLRKVLYIVKKSLRLLKKLHELGIIHNDIHMGNIAFKIPPSDTTPIPDPVNDELILIDFGYSEFIGKSEQFESIASFQSNPLLSHWQLQGARNARRDDIFRLGEIMAQFLYDDSPAKFLELLKQSTVPETLTSTLIRNKKANIFKDPLWNGKWENPAVFKNLEKFMDEILSYEKVTSQPNYEKLENILLATIAIVKTDMEKQNPGRLKARLTRK
jgi:serine/threonine protein kinase